MQYDFELIFLLCYLNRRRFYTKEKVAGMSGNWLLSNLKYTDDQADDYLYDEPYEESGDDPDMDPYMDPDEDQDEESYGESYDGRYGDADGESYRESDADRESYRESDVDREIEENGVSYRYSDEDAQSDRAGDSHISKPAKILTAINIIITLTLSLYYIVVFTDFPYISEARDLWIETAMTTADHQWLATWFLPRQLIERVMSRQIITDEDTLSNPNLLHPLVSGETARQPGMQDGNGESDSKDAAGGASSADAGSGSSNSQTGMLSPGDGTADGGSLADAGANAYLSPGGSEYALVPGKDIPIRLPGADFPGWGFFGAPEYEEVENTFPTVGSVDEFGNTVIVSDREEDITVVEIRKTGYTGRIMIVPDPSRVVVRHTRKKNVQGQLIKSFLTEYDAIAGMNGNGFDDPEGHGNGGSIIGWSVSDGAAWGEGAKSAYASVGFNDEHVLMVGTIKNFETHNIRDLAQYGPTLIVDGKKLISGSGGWGIQPRSAIGQREDGAVLMATFDGRQPGYSLGITAGEVADILYQYGCVNAGLCDGGSSSIMMYDGKVLGKPSTPMKDTGRYLPNAFLVLRNNSSAGTTGVGGVAEAAAAGATADTPKGKSSEV